MRPRVALVLVVLVAVGPFLILGGEQKLEPWPPVGAVRWWCPPPAVVTRWAFREPVDDGYRWCSEDALRVMWNNAHPGVAFDPDGDFSKAGLGP